MFTIEKTCFLKCFLLFLSISLLFIYRTNIVIISIQIVLCYKRMLCEYKWIQEKLLLLIWSIISFLHTKRRATHLSHFSNTYIHMFLFFLLNKRWAFFWKCRPNSEPFFYSAFHVKSFQFIIDRNAHQINAQLNYNGNGMWRNIKYTISR